MTGTSREESRNEGGKRSVEFCLGHADHELETSQRTDYCDKQVLGAHRSRGVVIRIIPFFLLDIRLDMIVFFLRVPEELRPGAWEGWMGSAEAEVLYQGVTWVETGWPAMPLSTGAANAPARFTEMHARDVSQTLGHNKQHRMIQNHAGLGRLLELGELRHICT